LPAPKKPIFELRKEFAPSFAAAEQIVAREPRLRVSQVALSVQRCRYRAAA
jgi:hypothetical protein